MESDSDATSDQALRGGRFEALPSKISAVGLKAYLRITHNSDDDLLEDLLDQAQDEALAFMNRSELPRALPAYRGRDKFDSNGIDSNAWPDAVSDSNDVAASVRGAIYLLAQGMYEGKDAAEMAAVRRAAEVKLQPYRRCPGV